jgi:hypothetical protein
VREGEYMESSAVYAQVQGDSVVITTDTGRKVTIELERGEGVLFWQLTP